jgi:hypothetical protein
MYRDELLHFCAHWWNVDWLSVGTMKSLIGQVVRTFKVTEFTAKFGPFFVKHIKHCESSGSGKQKQSNFTL